VARLPEFGARLPEGPGELLGPGRRSGILSAAARLFKDRGYAITTMDDLAAQIGLGKSSLYHYFRSKEEILAEIHEEFIELLIGHAEARSGRPASAAARLLGLIEDMVTFSARYPGHARTFFVPSRELPAVVRATVEERREHYLQIVEQAIVDGLADGEFAGVAPRMTARSIVGACSWVHDSALPPTQAADVAHALWHATVDGIAARP
jgi:AcrR family transcriptional regulator